jgi:Ca2+/H+ antiporter
MLCLNCTFGVLVEVSSATLFFLHCAVIFTVLFGFSSGGQSFRLSRIVGEVWVVCYYLFLCGLLSLSLSVLGECNCKEQQHQEESPPAKLHKHNSERQRTIFNSTQKPEHSTLPRPITTRTIARKERDNNIQPTPRQLDYSAWNFAHRRKRWTKQWT